MPKGIPGRAVCSIKGCEKFVVGHGWCSAHYSRWRRTGEVGGPVTWIRVTPGAVCAIEGCDKPMATCGWCGMHYARWKRHGDPLYTPPVRTHKRCNDCGETKPLSDFYRHERAQSWAPWCKPCYGHRQERRRQKNLQRDLDQKRARYRALIAADPDYSKRVYWADVKKSRAAKRADYEKHREKRLAANRQRLATDSEYKARFRAAQLRSNRKRRQRLGGKSRPGISRALIRQRMAYFGNRCWVCGGPEEHVDHVKPIAKGGAHMLCNLRPICASCNYRKSARWPFDPDLIRRAA